MAKGFRSWLKKYGAWAPVIIILGIIAVIVAAVVIPYVFIWALNTLFGLGIQFNFYTWLAALIIIAIIGSKGR
ncbi:MAG: hypothetical protein ACHQX1_00680 [Candidatus Micrarchaeales archaeon]